MKKFLPFFAAIAIVSTFVVSAMADDHDFYFSPHIAICNKNFGNNEILFNKDTNTIWPQQDTIRIYARKNITLNPFYGSGNFVNDLLHRNKTYTLFNHFSTNQVYGSDVIIWDSGGIYGGYEDIKQANFGSLKVALANPLAVNTMGIGVNNDSKLLKIKLKYSKSFDSILPAILGENKIYTIEAEADYDFDSIVFGAGGSANMGPAYFKANVFARKNTGQYKLWQVGADDAIVGTNVKDNHTLGYLAVVGFKTNDKLNFELGYGLDKHEIDTTGKEENNTSIVYLQAAINLTDNFFIVPELGEYNFGDDSTGKEESMTYFGAKWQMNF